jgi:uncharacterized protein (TIGR01777 family)
MKIVIAGGAGYIGRALVGSLVGDGHEVVVLSRRPETVRELPARVVSWDAAFAEVDGAGAVVNVAGVPIGGPLWTRRRKEAILASRVDTTHSLVEAVKAARRPPDVFVSASGIDFAGNSGDSLVDETTPFGATFLARVCSAWEAAAVESPVRNVQVRTSLVVGPGAQAIKLMALPFRLFAGGPLGNGQQWFPWVDLDDLVRVYRAAIDDSSLDGPVNAVSPGLLRQREAAKVFGAVLHCPSLLPTPAIALRLLLGEQADLLLHGQRALTVKLDEGLFRVRDLRASLVRAL